MPGEDHLHQPAAILRYDLQLEPAVRKLLCAPTLVIRGLDATQRTRLAGLSFCPDKRNIQVQPTNKKSYCIAPHRSLFLDRRCPDSSAVNDRISNPRIGVVPSSHLLDDALSLDETKLNETKHLNLRQADSVVYQVHRLMSPIPKKMFSRSGIHCDALGACPSREFTSEGRNPRSAT